MLLGPERGVASPSQVTFDICVARLLKQFIYLAGQTLNKSECHIRGEKKTKAQWLGLEFSNAVNFDSKSELSRVPLPTYENCCVQFCTYKRIQACACI